MEWIILVLLVPAVIVPVVLLFGFAGCAKIVGIEDIHIVPRERLPSPLPTPPAEQVEPVVVYEHTSSDPAGVAEDLTVNKCVVQLFHKAAVPSGTLRKIRVTVRASPSNNLTIKRAYASWRAASEPWDSLDAGFTTLRDSPLTVTAGTTALLEAECRLSDTLVHTDLLVAFDVDGWGMTFPKPPHGGFIELNEEAKQKDRSFPVDQRPDSVMLIERIDFLRVKP